MSPWDRAIFSLIVNPVSNALTNIQRPDHKHHRDLTPIDLLGDDCLQHTDNLDGRANAGT